MFFFFYFGNSIGRLGENRIVNIAFERVIKDRIYAEGYCDINPFLNNNHNKSYFLNELQRVHSPLVKLFKEKYPRNIEELERIMLPLLEENEELLNDERTVDYNCFVIVYYILLIFKTSTEKLFFLVSLCKKAEFSREESGVNDYFEIREQDGIIYNSSLIDIRFINNLQEYIVFLNEEKEPGCEWFYRGHSDVSYKLLPSLFRNTNYLYNEKRMYLDLMSRCPADFEGLNTHFDKLVKMQHYGLPTRILDVTSNPLIALYFACEFLEKTIGEVVLLSDVHDNIKYFQSDKVAIMSSLPLFTYDEQKDYYLNSMDVHTEEERQRFTDTINRLVYEVGLERNGFRELIEPDDVRDAVICIPQMKNKRIYNQEGAFIVCGLLDEIYGEEKARSLSKFRIKNRAGKRIICLIKGSNKKKILKELDNIGINEARVYPELDRVAEYIKSHL